MFIVLRQITRFLTNRGAKFLLGMCACAVSLQYSEGAFLDSQSMHDPRIQPVLRGKLKIQLRTVVLELHTDILLSGVGLLYKTYG